MAAAWSIGVSGGDAEDPGDGYVGDLLLVQLETHQLAFDLIR